MRRVEILYTMYPELDVLLNSLNFISVNNNLLHFLYDKSMAYSDSLVFTKNVKMDSYNKNFNDWLRESITLGKFSVSTNPSIVFKLYFKDIMSKSINKLFKFKFLYLSQCDVLVLTVYKR